MSTEHWISPELYLPGGPERRVPLLDVLLLLLLLPESLPRLAKRSLVDTIRRQRGVKKKKKKKKKRRRSKGEEK